MEDKTVNPSEFPDHQGRVKILGEILWLEQLIFHHTWIQACNHTLHGAMGFTMLLGLLWTYYDDRQKDNSWCCSKLLAMLILRLESSLFLAGIFICGNEKAIWWGRASRQDREIEKAGVRWNSKGEVNKERWVEQAEWGGTDNGDREQTGWGETGRVKWDLTFNKKKLRWNSQDETEEAD